MQRHLAGQFKQEQLEQYRTKVANGEREAFEDTDLLHCDLEIEILPSQYDNMVGSNTLTIQSKSNSLTQFTIRLRSQYSIDGAYINGSTPVSSHKHLDHHTHGHTRPYLYHGRDLHVDDRVQRTRRITRLRLDRVHDSQRR